MGAPPPLLWLLMGGLWLQSVCAGSHSLRYYLYTLSEPLPGVPQFFSQVFVDDVQIDRFSSGSRVEPLGGPRGRSMNMFRSYVPHWDEDWNRLIGLDPQYWEWHKIIAQEPQNLEWQNNKLNEQASAANMKYVMSRVNETRGLHVLQWVFGCDLRAEGSFEMLSQHGFDGRDFFSFDTSLNRNIAASEAARIIVDRWNSNRRMSEGSKGYLNGTCIPYLRKQLEIKKESLQRRVRPETIVYLKKTGAGTTLTCCAYGFYPREIDMKWVRNGVEMPWTSKQILPHPDGTYQVKTTVEVYEGDDERNYTCQVDQSILEEVINVVYVPSEDKSSSSAYIGLVAAVIVGVVAAVIGGFAFWKKKRSASRQNVEEESTNQPLQRNECDNDDSTVGKCSDEAHHEDKAVSAHTSCYHGNRQVINL